MPVDIAFSINHTLQMPLLVVINSILSNTTHEMDQAPLRFNIVVPIGESASLITKLEQTFLAQYSREQVEFRVEEFAPPTYLKEYLDNKFKEKKRERQLSRYMQYARLFFRDVFSDIGRMIYFDADIIVLGDVRSLFAQGDILTPQNYLAAVPQFFPAIFYFSNSFKVLSDLRKFKSTFNSGVLLTDLSFWTEQTYELLRHYLELDEKNSYRLYHLGDETVFNLMFKDTYIPLTKQWNCCGYGQAHWISRLLRKNPEDMKAIHWSGGHHKPWESEQVIYSDIWRKYLPA